MLAQFSYGVGRFKSIGKRPDQNGGAIHLIENPPLSANSPEINEKLLIYKGGTRKRMVFLISPEKKTEMGATSLLFRFVWQDASYPRQRKLRKLDPHCAHFRPRGESFELRQRLHLCRIAPLPAVAGRRRRHTESALPLPPFARPYRD